MLSRRTLSLTAVVAFCITIFSYQALALNTTVTLQADSAITPTSTEVVTFGLPIAEGEVTNSDQLRVLLNGVEQAIYVAPGLRWHWSDNSLRSVTIQLQEIDMTTGNLSLVITDEGRNTANDRTERPHADGWTNAAADKNSLPYPRIFALHDPDYLDDTGIVPPYRAGPTTPDAFEQLQSKQFDNWAGGLNYGSSSGANWLFDRSSAMFKAYLSTGEVKFLKEAFLSKQFYFTYVRSDGTSPRPSGGDGCWTFGTVACADGKYIAPQQAKLAWAVFGDSGQWTNDLINNMALQADLGWNQYGTRDPYDGETEGFTERAAGLVGLAELSAYEITGNTTVLSHIQERVGSLQDMQQTGKSWDQANGWIPKSGAFTHSWDVHEGNHSVSSAPKGVADDRRFSPWMSENLADFLWQAYHITNDSRIPEMLRRLGDAIDLYGFASSYQSGSGTSAVYTRKTGISGWNKCGGPDPLAVETMYSGSDFASNSALQSTHQSNGFTDNHNIELVLPLALAYQFETDDGIRTRLRARIEKLIEQWTETSVRDCSTIFDGVHRLWNWQHRSNSIRTWQWVIGESTLPVPPPPPPPGAPVAPSNLQLTAGSTAPGGGTDDTSGSGSGGSSGGSGTATLADLSGWVLITNDPTCSEAMSWHWQCGNGRVWVSAGDAASANFIATCMTPDGDTCANVGNNRSWHFVSSVTANTFVMVCDRQPLTDDQGGCAAANGNVSYVTPSGDSGSSGSSGSGGGTSSGSGAPVVGTSLAFTNVTLSTFPDLVPGQAPVVAPFEADLAHIDRDGCLDAFITSHSTDEPDGIYLQDYLDGTCRGTFAHLPNHYAMIAPPNRRITSGVKLFDLDGNSHTDILGMDADGNPSLAATQDATPGNFTGTTGCLFTTDRCLPIDFNGDGKIELIAAPLVPTAFNDDVTNTPTNTQIFGTIYSWPQGQVLWQPSWSLLNEPNLTRAWSTSLVFDANNDSYPDILNPQLNIIWFNGPNGMQTGVEGNFSASPGLFRIDYTQDDGPHSNSNHQIPIDFDNDGDVDIFKIRVKKGGNHAIDLADADGDGNGIWLLQNDGTGKFTDVSTTELAGLHLISLTYQTTYAGLGIGDFNNDGRTDIRADWLDGSFLNTCVILVNGGPGNWHKESFPCGHVLDNTDGKVAATGGASKTVITHGDYDNDGRLDLFLSTAQQNSTKDTLALWRNTRDDVGNWLTFFVKGAPTSEGWHTRVTVKAAGSSEILCTREIYVSHQYGSIQEHCGLGGNGLVDVTLRYPSGGPLVTFANVAANQHLILDRTNQPTAWAPGSGIPQ